MLPSSRRGHRRRHAEGGAVLDRSGQMTTCSARRRPTVVLVVLAMLAGVSVVYLRLWAVDSGFSSSEDREFLRKQFDRANIEAMDESAEWRMKYDAEVERARRYKEEAKQAKDAIANAKESVAFLQKENTNLNLRLATLRHDMETMRQNCTCNLPSRPSKMS
ncbi:hypothetical protein Taro_017919 [Colocasia esculenta]|uniref:Uncharacterized protein n=1 Tax=Colocasia esculenta TaxID=4460 RepID=A0A843UQ00_COLES|nr:hypothetical protein [Colocasia esculenta]